MGRYLSLSRNAASAAVAEKPNCNKDEPGNQRGRCEGLRSFRSFMSYPDMRPTAEALKSRLSESASFADKETVIEPNAPVTPGSPVRAVTTKTTETTKPYRSRRRDDFEERAAIIEHEGKIPPVWAQGFAQLNPDCVPANVPPQRWRQFVDDVGVFLDSRFCAVAEALGWGPHDLFGADRERPYARIDQAGLLWLLNGDKLVALARDTAVIETKTGSKQTYRRKPVEPGRMLAWELAINSAGDRSVHSTRRGTF